MNVFKLKSLSFLYRLLKFGRQVRFFEEDVAHGSLLEKAPQFVQQEQPKAKAVQDDMKQAETVCGRRGGSALNGKNKLGSLFRFNNVFGCVKDDIFPVSYTHLTLPTILLV